MPINFAVKLAATVALEAVQIGLQASKRTYGPRLDELTVTVSDYGTPIPRFLGERRFACSIPHAEDLKEVEQTSKVKGGGKQTTYHYLATFMAVIADNEIDKVLKIFFDDKLVYDATGTGPISYAASLGIDLNSVMRIYKGTEDQEPDPRYAAWCEDRYGADSAPAYRGVSYLFFEELPVDNFGNRIPQISVIATAAAAAAYPWESYAASPTWNDAAQFSPDFSRFYLVSNDKIGVWDTATRTQLFTITAPTSLGNAIGVGEDGSLYVSSDGITGQGLWKIGPDGGAVLLDYPFEFTSGVRYAGGTIFLYPYSFLDFGTISYFDGASVVTRDVDFNPKFFFEDEEGNGWAIGNADGGQIGLYDFASSSQYLIDSPGSGNPFGMDNGEGQFFVRHGSFHLLIDKETMEVVTSAAASGGSTRSTFENVKVGASSIWYDHKEVSTRDLSTIRTASGWSGVPSANEHVYDPINNAILGNGGGLLWEFLDRFSNSGTTLGAIVDAMCDAAGLEDRDTSALTQTVKGYSWTRGDVKSQMEPVLDIHDVDARPHDFEIEFLPRGSASSGTILTANFAKNGDDSTRYKVTIAQDTDLPKMLRVNFADTEFDQQTNNVLSPLTLNEVDSQRDDVIDLTTYAATPDEAQKLSDRYLRRRWNGRESIENSLTAQYLAIEPGDVKTLDLDGIQQTARLVKQTIAGGRIDCIFVRDEVAIASLNSSTTGPSMDGRDTETIQIPGPVRGFVIDAPYREDTDEDVRPLLFTGAGVYASLSFPGATIYEATGIPAVYDTVFSAVTTGATWGTCGGTLGNANANLWDRGNTLSVTLHSGTLTSCAEADIDADPTLNLILVGSEANGWEYVNFTTATLVSGSTYTLSGFKRGRRGTEWMCSQHGSGEAFILASSLDVEEMGTNDVGGDFSFKAQSLGRSLDAAVAIDVEPYTGATLKPYAPARIKWTTDGTDMFGEIIRRTRIGGSWIGGSTIPLSENSEEYEVDILDGATVLRTITVTGTNTFTYTGSQISTDGNSVGVAPDCNVYQMSDAVGRGYALAA
jgi:hypothetical protein